MISIGEVKRQYAAMLLQHTEPVKENHVNCYTCHSGHTTKTIDVDNGTTPFLFDCPTCGLEARS